MTKVARLYEEKRLAAVALMKEQMEKEKEEAVRQLEEEKEEKTLKLTAMKWIIKGRTPQEAARESGLSVEEVEELLK